MNVFAAGQDGALRQFALSPGGGWVTSVAMPVGTLSTTAGVSAVRIGTTLEVFAVGTDATLVQVEQMAAGSAWQRTEIRPDVKVVGAPSVVWDSTGESVFAAGQDGALHRFSFTGASAGGHGGSWTVALLTPAGTLSLGGGVSAVRVGPKIEVFAVGRDGTLLQEERATVGSSWKRSEIRAEVKIAGAPSVVWNASGVSVFAAEQDGALRQFSFSRVGGWTPSVLAPAGTLSAGGGVSAGRIAGKSEVFAVTSR